MASSSQNSRQFCCYSVRVLRCNESYMYHGLIFGLTNVTMVPGSVFKFSIRVFAEDSPRIVLLSCPPTPIPCQSFREEGEDFLRTLFSRGLPSTSFWTEIIQQVVEYVSSEVQDIFLVDVDVDAASTSSESQTLEIPLLIGVRFSYNTITGSRMRMIQPSKEATDTLLKKCIVEKERCCICLEEFVENAECYSMPCDHLFHKKCIVCWLQIRFNCPLCRYSLPTPTREGS